MKSARNRYSTQRLALRAATRSRAWPLVRALLRRGTQRKFTVLVLLLESVALQFQRVTLHSVDEIAMQRSLIREREKHSSKCNLTFFKV